MLTFEKEPFMGTENVLEKLTVRRDTTHVCLYLEMEG